MQWIIYSAALVNQVTRQATRQIRRAPLLKNDDPHLAAQRLGGTLLAVQKDVRRAEGLRRMTELQAILAGHAVAEWTPPADWRQETPRSFPIPATLPSRGRYPRLAWGT